MKPKVTKNIVQLMPAQGWFCKYKQDDGTIEYSRVACFALLRITEPTAAYEMVVAMQPISLMAPDLMKAWNRPKVAPAVPSTTS